MQLATRPARPRPLEILSSSAVNREVGSFASSEVNRALKASTTFSLPLSEMPFSPIPSLLILHSLFSSRTSPRAIRTGNCGALRSTKVTKHRDTDARVDLHPTSWSHVKMLHVVVIIEALFSELMAGVINDTLRRGATEKVMQHYGRSDVRA